ncbi:MAG: hypothetical protein AB7H80_00405 [Candidatus Kapaibacterium sp.]
MGTTSSELTWTATVMPAMVAGSLRERGEKATQSVVPENVEGDVQVIGQLTFQYVRYGGQKPFAAYLQTEKGYHWRASKVVYCDPESPAQNVDTQPVLSTPFLKLLEECTISSFGKK